MLDPVVSTRLVTAVIGAGPAGLLFCIGARILHERTGRPASHAPIYLFDKRDNYSRTHPLRMDRAPYRALQQQLDDPRFDSVMDFLESEGFRPVVNDLEARLVTLAAELGISKERMSIGPEDTTLSDMRAILEQGDRLEPRELLFIVGADSVHSATRELLTLPDPSAHHTHQQLVRLRVEGPGLPSEISVMDQIRLSKLLDSLLDYHLKQDGYAEVNLFLDPAEHEQLSHLEAAPSEPVPLDVATLTTLSAPLFCRIVNHLADGFGAGPCKLSVTSTFRLEHRVSSAVVFQRPELSAIAVLVGDAAVSLPFFRGMACLARCVAHLTRDHADMVAAEPELRAAIAARYQDEVAEVVRTELSMVAARARLIGLIREVARISAMLPFPIQSWFLSVPDRDVGRGPTAGFVLNLSLALPSAAIALSAPVLDAFMWEPLGWLWLISVPLQAVGGAVYYAVRLSEPGPDVWVKAVWRWQIFGLLVLGPAITLLNSWWLNRLAQAHSLVSWFVLGMAFVSGLYLFEWFQRRRWNSADLDAG